MLLKNLPVEILEAIKLVKSSSYGETLHIFKNNFILTKDEGVYADFSTQGGNTFRLRSYKDDELLGIDFDIKSTDVEDMDEEEREDAVEEYFNLWQDLTRDFAKVFGKPQYSDGFGNEGYPEDTEAQWVSLWPIEKHRLTLEVHDAYNIFPQYISAVFRLA